MGAVLMPVMSHIAALSEIVGSRAGLALNRQDLHEILSNSPSYDGFALASDTTIIRLRSEVIEELVAHLMYKVGRIEQQASKFFFIDLYHKYKSDPKKQQVLQELGSPFMEALAAGGKEARASAKQAIDPEPIMRLAVDKHGKLGLDVVVDLMQGFNQSLVINPWTRIVSREWTDTVQLEDLFKSEALETQYGTFLDQRYIDYLSNNHERIGDMNWRKFEALTAEYFERAGCRVELGPGRNDDGVDVRVWPQHDDPSKAPLILIQCKRQRSTVEKVVVKSLYADMLHENATGGLIVTSSRLSPGAQQVCQAREYPIDQVDREALKQWLKNLRTPGTGVFLGE